MVPFDQAMMTTSWEDFVTEILVKRYHAVHLVAGHDHHFGHKNQGTPELVADKCRCLLYTSALGAETAETKVRLALLV